MARPRAPRPVDSFRLIVVPDARRLDSLTRGRAPAWAAAIALPESRTIVLRADGEALPRILRHELAHLTLHQAVRGRVPLWFDEGYAGWAAGEWDRLGLLELNLSVAPRGVAHAHDARCRPRARRHVPADAAYALAVSAVTELARRNLRGRSTR